MNRVETDKLAQKSMKLILGFSCILLLSITLVLGYKSVPLLQQVSLIELLFSSSWAPLKGSFGFASFIMGTLVVTFLALLIAVPICILTAIYLSEYASIRVRSITKPLIDLLAGIPSVVFGLWGISLIVPLVRYNVAPYFGISTTGYCILSASIVLAIMIFPMIISTAEEVLNAVPFHLRETAYALGATKWQTVKHIVLKDSAVGVLASVILGFSRAIGETMAVLMVVGNIAKTPTSLFDPAYTLPALIANNYGEMMSLPLYDSALMFSALILLILVGGFSVTARILQRKIGRMQQ